MEKTLGDGILNSLRVETKNYSSTVGVLALPEPFGIQVSEENY